MQKRVCHPNKNMNTKLLISIVVFCFVFFVSFFSFLSNTSVVAEVEPVGHTYTLRTKSDLEWFRNKVNGVAGETADSFAGCVVVLGADIDLLSSEWMPIGTEENPFAGTFDGAGHNVSHIRIMQNSIYNGFFGYGVSCSIKNLIISNLECFISDLSGTNAYSFLGGLIGSINGTQEDKSKIEKVGIINSEMVTVNEHRNLVCVGGIAGAANNTNFFNVYSMAEKYYDKSESHDIIHSGGIIGQSESSNVLSNSFYLAQDDYLAEKGVVGAGRYRTYNRDYQVSNKSTDLKNRIVNINEATIADNFSNLDFSQSFVMATDDDGIVGHDYKHPVFDFQLPTNNMKKIIIKSTNNGEMHVELCKYIEFTRCSQNGISYYVPTESFSYSLSNSNTTSWSARLDSYESFSLWNYGCESDSEDLGIKFNAIGSKLTIERTTALSTIELNATLMDKAIRIRIQNSYGQIVSPSISNQILSLYVDDALSSALFVDASVSSSKTIRVELEPNSGSLISLIGWTKSYINKPEISFLTSNKSINVFYEPNVAYYTCIVDVDLSLFEPEDIVCPIDTTVYPEDYWSITETESLVGDGTIENPYQIGNKDDLILFKNMIESDPWSYANKSYELTHNIDLSTKQWIPIGDENSYAFNGIFDGNGYSISNVLIKESEDVGEYAFLGFFRGLGVQAVVKNLTLDNVFVNYSGAKNNVLAGALAGRASDDCQIIGCVFSGKITITSGKNLFVGGVCGLFNGSISLTESDVDVVVDIDTTNIESNTVGGICGQMAEDSLIANCFVTGDIAVNTVTSQKSMISRLVGQARLLTIKNVYYSGQAQYQAAASSELANGFSNSVINSYYLETTSNISDKHRRTDEQLKNSSTFENWDFEHVWTFNEHVNNGYPIFGIGEMSKIEIKFYSDGVLLTEEQIDFYPAITYLPGSFSVDDEENPTTRIYTAEQLDQFENVKIGFILKKGQTIEAIDINGIDVLNNEMYKFSRNELDFLSSPQTIGEYSVYMRMPSAKLNLYTAYKGKQSLLGGSINLNSDDYQIGSTLSLHAIPNAGFEFAGWWTEPLVGTKVSSLATMDYIVPDQESTLYAKFIESTVCPIGTEVVPSENKYLVSNMPELLWIANQVNSGANDFLGKTIVLTNNINLSSLNWTPIGNPTNKFKGTFDGGSFGIIGLKINTVCSDAINHIGFFGYVENAEIKNFAIYDAEIFIDDAYEKAYTGIMVGKADGLALEKCFVAGALTTTTNCAGFVCEYGSGVASIKNSYSLANLTKKSLQAGIVAGVNAIRNGATISNVYVAGQIQINKTENQNNITVYPLFSGEILRSFFDAEVGYYINGEKQVFESSQLFAKNTLQMKDVGTFQGWDFVNDWKIYSNNIFTMNGGYPILSIFDSYQISITGDNVTTTPDKQLFNIGEYVTISILDLQDDENVNYWLLNGAQILDLSEYVQGRDFEANTASLSFYLTPEKVGAYEVSIGLTEYDVYFNYNYDIHGDFFISKGNSGGIIMPIADPVREGFSFVKWSKTTSGDLEDDNVVATTPITENTIVYAIWRSNLYDLTVDMNDGSPSARYNSALSVEGVDLTKFNINNTPTRLGYEFVEWNQNQDGTGLVATDSTKFLSNKTIYAIWRIVEYVVSFDYNFDDGIVVDSTGSIEGTITIPNPARLGYTFIGWAHTSDAVAADYDETESVTEDIIYYAIWSETEYRVVFHTEDDTIYVVKDNWTQSNKQFPQIPLKEGYSFFCWRTLDGSLFDENTVVYADTNVYAQWEVANGSIRINMFITTGNVGRLNNDYAKVILCDSEGTKKWVFWLGNSESVKVAGLVFDTYTITVILPTYYTQTEVVLPIELTGSNNIVVQDIAIESNTGTVKNFLTNG